MTCREFKHGAADLTLWELARGENAELLSHSEKCEACSGWLQKQQTLAVSIQTLQARTAGLEAGPDVERALLRAFRQDTHQGMAPSLREVGNRSGSSRPAVTPLSTPIAMRLSRVFEVGTYVALAAALVVGVFLGVRLLEHRSGPDSAQSKVAPAAPDPAAQSASAATLAPEPTVPVERATARRKSPSHPRPTVQPAIEKAPNEDTDTLAAAGYTDLMFCDPLSCASDTQVVRMELSGNEQGSQPQVADLVVGYDGVVRAVRIVN